MLTSLWTNVQQKGDSRQAYLTTLPTLLKKNKKGSKVQGNKNINIYLNTQNLNESTSVTKVNIRKFNNLHEWSKQKKYANQNKGVDRTLYTTAWQQQFGAGGGAKYRLKKESSLFCCLFFFQWSSSALLPYLWQRSHLPPCWLSSTTSSRSVWMPSKWSVWNVVWFRGRRMTLVSWVNKEGSSISTKCQWCIWSCLCCVL